MGRYTVAGLDLSKNYCGVAILNSETKFFTLVRDKQESLLQFAKRIAKLVKKYKPKCVICEDVYYGINFREYKEVLRLQGILWSFLPEMQFKYAIHVRKVVGIDPHATKADIQLFVLHYMLKQEVNKAIYSKLLNLKTLRKEKKLSRSKYRYQCDKLSKAIEKETGVSEHVADAIILALAALKEGLCQTN